MSTSVDEFLAHYGVKGMRWGKRKAQVSRKENRQMNRDAANEFYTNKADKLYSESKKGGEKVLVKSRTPGDYATNIMTGKQFVDLLEKGTAIDIKSTEIFARQLKAGEEYVLNNEEIGTYKVQNFRKTS